MKRREDDGNWFPCPRSIFKHEGFKAMSPTARLVFFYLLEMEHRYTGKECNYFFRSNKELAEEAGLSEKTIQNAKDEFREHIPDLIRLSYVHWWLDKTKTKQSPKKVSGYTIKV